MGCKLLFYGIILEKRLEGKTKNTSGLRNDGINF